MSEEILDKKSKLVLKVLNKIKNDDNFVAGSQAVLPYMPKKYNQQIIDEVLWHLEDLGYIECQSSEGHVQYINANYISSVANFIRKSGFVNTFSKVSSVINAPCIDRKSVV